MGLAFSMTLSAALTSASPPTTSDRDVGVEAPGCDLGVPVQDLDVLEGDPEPVGDDLAERRFVALPVRARR